MRTARGANAISVTATLCRSPKPYGICGLPSTRKKLLEGLETVDYLPNIKQQQVNWIGKSKGAFVNFRVDGKDETLRSTPPDDTLFGVTFMVIAPEHPMIDRHEADIANMDEIRDYREACAKKTEFERTQLVKDKTGVKIQGLEAVNPLNGKKIPDLYCGLCNDGLWNRSHHGGACPRPARL